MAGQAGSGAPRNRAPGRTRRGSGLAVALAVVLLACAGCIGSTPRADFDATVQARSGGIAAALPERALAALAERFGTDAFGIRSLVIDGENRRVMIEAQDPAQRDNLDTYRFTDRTLSDPEPILLSASDPIEATTFRAAEVPALRRVDDLVDRTLDELGIADAHVTQLSVSRSAPDGVRIVLAATSDRASGRATFDADGTLLDAVRT